MSSLFRPEVAEGRRQAWLGSIRLVRPVSLTVLTVWVAVAAVLVAVFFSVGEYTRKARVGGHLVPDRGVIRLVAPQSSQVLERSVSEGQRVRAGDVLFVLSLERNAAQGDTRDTVRASLEARQHSLQAAMDRRQTLQQAQASALAQQLHNMQRERDQLAAEAVLHQQRLTLVQSALARLQSLRAEQFVSDAQVQAKQEELLGIQAQLQAVLRQQAAHAREIDLLTARQRELPLAEQAELGQMEREIAELTQASAENEAQRRVVVRAPQDGIVSTVMAEPGQSVAAQSPLAQLLPEGAQLQAHLFAPSSAMGFVRPDQTVLLRYQAYPHQKFGHQLGRVLQVSRTPVPPGAVGAPAADAEPMYRITVALEAQSVLAYGQPQALSPGMQLEADVLLDRRRLIEWIFEPVLGLAGRV